MDYFQEIIYDVNYPEAKDFGVSCLSFMKTVRHLSEINIIFTDESLREAGKKGAIAGKELRKRLIL